MMLAKDYYFRIDSQDLEREKKGQLVVEAAQYFYQAVTPVHIPYNHRQTSTGYTTSARC
jgi:hypothetical protein